MSARHKDLTGQRFGRLLALRRAWRSGKSGWLCVCDCGREHVVITQNLLSKTGVRSCGCLNVENRMASIITHGMTNTRAFTVWQSMKSRCRYLPRYRDRGIRVCERWENSLLNFVADMGEPPPGMDIDRIDNDGSYEPDNCRWATRKENCVNRRSTHWLTHNGKTQTMTDWARERGMGVDTLCYRLRTGWPIESALDKPVRAHRRG